jgi:hypothetical protein
MSVPYLQVGPSSRGFSQCGHFESHVFRSQVEFDFYSYVVSPHDWLWVHVVVTSICRTSSEARLH